MKTDEQRLAQMIAKFTLEVAEVAKAARAVLRELLPGAVELVYDNYNALVIGYGPTDKTSQVVLSIALYPRWVTIFFANGATLPDPKRLLQGAGKQVRGIRLADATTLDLPAVRKLIATAVARSAPPIDASQPDRLVIKSVVARQRTRRPAPKAKRTTKAK